jgi:tRNA A-37 threonylcarbamoyl transferase component Bud32
MSQSKERSREGEVLNGKYLLEELLDIGGMGVIYRARNTAIDRTVVVKMLRDELVDNESYVTRFLREARAANVVQHKNIVSVFDIDKTEAGVPFIVQEYLQGETLSQLLKRGGQGLPYGQVLDIMLPVIDAIGEAHAKGLVHRDIKPSNIFITRQMGTIVAKILDFGVSKIAMKTAEVSETEPGPAPALGDQDLQVTLAGEVLGSPAYMSPEQIQSPLSVDARSDVWSLGVLLYEMLCGRRPFAATRAAEMMDKICNDVAVPLNRIVADVPESLVEVVARCLKQDPQARYADARELAYALREVRGQVFPGLNRDRDSGAAPAAQPAAAQTVGPGAGRAASVRDLQQEARGAPATPTHEAGGARPGAWPFIIAFLVVPVVMLMTDAVLPDNLLTGGGIASAPSPTVPAVSAFLLVLLTQLVRQRSEAYPVTGVYLFLSGLFALFVGMLVMALSIVLVFPSILQVVAALMPLAVAAIAAGYCVCGVMLARQQQAAPAASPVNYLIFGLSLVAAIVGIFYLIEFASFLGAI